MFRKKPILQYESAVEIYPNIVTPAKKHIPDWYKEIPKWKNEQIFEVGKGFNMSIKHCMPFIDSLISGYIIVLPNDLYVKNNHGAPLITWKGIEFPPKAREDLSSSSLVPTGHYPIEFTWQTGLASTIPLGYSALFTHPLNRFDLPFTTLSAVVDGGLVMNPSGSIPFFIKDGFEGIIPQGTPIIQIIPYRQENWIHKKTNGLLKKSYEHNARTSSVIYGWYKKTFWTQKKYD